MNNFADIPTKGFVRLSTVLTVIPISKSAWYAGVADGRFPRPVQLGPRTSAWRAEDIVNLIQRLGSEKGK